MKNDFNEEKFDISKSILNSVIESITDVVIAVDKAKIVLLYNAKAKDIFKSIETGNDITNCIGNCNPLLELFDEALLRGASFQKEIPFSFLKGEKVFRVLVSGVKCDSKTIGAVAVFSDVTKFKAVDELRNELISQVSHELRTPLTAIKAYLEILTDDVIESEEGKEYLKIIDEKANILTRLIENLITVSELESRKLNLNEQQVSMRKIIERVLNILHKKFEEKELVVTSKFPEEDIKVACDDDKIGKVIINIVGNAIKYTPKNGRIEIALFEDGEQACISVKDNGMGISEGDKKNLFKKFFYSERQEVRDIGGAGLGLYIAKQIVESHNGEISVESELGKGSTFTIKLISK